MGRLISMGLNVSTFGTWGVLKWLVRRFKGDRDRQTFLYRVSVFVAGSFVYSALTGTISPWGLLKMLGKATLFVCVFILNSCGGEGKLPEAEEAETKNIIAKAKDALGNGLDKVKAEADEIKRKAAEEIVEKRRAFDASILAQKAENFKRDADERAAKARRDAEEEIARVKARAAEKERELAAKAKAEIKEHTPSPWALMFGGARPTQPKTRTRAQMEQYNRLMRSPSAKLTSVVCLACGHIDRFTLGENFFTCRKCGHVNDFVEGSYFESTGMYPVGLKVAMRCESCKFLYDFVGDGKSDRNDCPKCGHVNRNGWGTFMRGMYDRSQANQSADSRPVQP